MAAMGDDDFPRDDSGPPERDPDAVDMFGAPAAAPDQQALTLKALRERFSRANGK